jgi:nucleotide-binding universal stress UspA family protein
MAARPTPALTVTAAQPRRVTWPVTLEASGSIAAWQEASIDARVGGYGLIDVLVNVGDQVTKGQVLARFDPSLLQADAVRLQANADGAFVALLIARSELDMPAMIGVVMLIGIVSKNSILLVEYTVVSMRDHGLPPGEAVLAACRNRARAIVMTTFAMTAGMLPLALGYGADSSFRQPMAIAAIGGLLSSTALSLLVVPVVFTYVDGFERRVSRFWRRERERAHRVASPL